MQRLLARYQADGANFLDGNPKRLLPDLYYLGDFHGTAVYGLQAESKFFLIDAPGGSRLSDFVKSQQRELGLPPMEPFAILLTACDEKETAGLRELVERTNARVVVAAEGVALVKQLCP